MRKILLHPFYSGLIFFTIALGATALSGISIPLAVAIVCLALIYASYAQLFHIFAAPWSWFGPIWTVAGPRFAIWVDSLFMLGLAVAVILLLIIFAPRAR